MFACTMFVCMHNACTAEVVPSPTKYQLSTHTPNLRISTCEHEAQHELSYFEPPYTHTRVVSSAMYSCSSADHMKSVIGPMTFGLQHQVNVAQKIGVASQVSRPRGVRFMEVMDVPLLKCTLDPKYGSALTQAHRGVGHVPWEHGNVTRLLHKLNGLVQESQRRIDISEPIARPHLLVGRRSRGREQEPALGSKQLHIDR